MKFILIILLAIILSIGSFFITQNKESTTSVKPPVVKSAQKEQPITSQNIPSTPNRIIIEKLEIDAPIESVGLDDANKMDVPKDPDNAGWYNLGYKPGDTGSAVVAGHVDTPTGAPAIFYNLSKLTTGDKIKITDNEKNNHVFTVIETKIFPFDKVPLQEIFASDDKKRLNLITCDGSFDKKNKNYTMRRVVYAEQKE